MSDTPAPRSHTMLVVHEPGSPDGGAGWRDHAIALRLNALTPKSAWKIAAPDLPGHRSAPPPGGNYDTSTPGFEAIRSVMQLDDPPEVIVGVGASGWAAQLLRLAGYGERLVLIDGLGHPWRTAAERSADRRQLLRDIVSDNTAGPWEPTVDQPVDPRLPHGVPPHGSLTLATKAARATPGPVLIVTTDDRPSLDAATQSVIDCFADATVVRAASTAADDVIETIVNWLSEIGSSTSD